MFLFFVFLSVQNLLPVDEMEKKNLIKPVLYSSYNLKLNKILTK